MANLQHLKASRIQILSSLPSNSFGKDSDIVLSHVRGRGVFLCSKVGGQWYAANRLQELKNIEQSNISKIITKDIKITDITKSSRDTDNFVVSDAGQLKYRTGDEIVGDLDIPVNDIDYKTAYCSLGQYTDKDSCKANGGTWYYSENDSHDSISSTAENQLLTVGSSIGKLDSESTLLYDGSTLEIKRNTDFDDNWQTSAQTNLLKLSYDSSNSAIFSVDSLGSLTLQPDGDLILDPVSTKVIIRAANKLYFDSGVDTYITESGADMLDFYVGAVNLLKLTEAGGGGSDKVSIPFQTGLYFDGGGDTYIHEANTDSLGIKVGGDYLLTLTEYGADGNEVLFKTSCATFTRQEATFSATTIIGSLGTDDTDIDFRFSNKFRLEMTGDITTINLIFPKGAGNFVLACTTDGDHDVTNWKVWENDESAATTADVMWAGGSVPAFTNNGVDVVSFYWDAQEQQCYGVASLAFATP